LKSVVSKTRAAEDFQNPKRNIKNLSISFRFRKLFQIKAPQVGAFVFEKSGFQKPEQWWIFILYIKNTYRLQIYF